MKRRGPVLRRNVMRAVSQLRRALQLLERARPLDAEFEQPVVRGVLADAHSLLAAIVAEGPNTTSWERFPARVTRA